jgi:hypothetical protein
MAAFDGVHGQEGAGVFHDEWSSVVGLDDNWETQY